MRATQITSAGKVSQASEHRFKSPTPGFNFIKLRYEERLLTRWGAGLNLGGGGVSVCVLVAPGSVPARQPQRLEAQAQVCDTRRCPG